MTTRDFNLCISLINLASNIQILNNCIQHVGTNRPKWDSGHLPNIHRSVPGDSQFDLKTYQASIITYSNFSSTVCPFQNYNLRKRIEFEVSFPAAKRHSVIHVLYESKNLSFKKR